VELINIPDKVDLFTLPTVTKPSPVAIHTHFTQSVIANMLGDISESRSFAVYGKLFHGIAAD